MDNWDEIKTAYYVAKEGTVTAAANTLGVHRATVIRHIDSLEKKLGEKVFIRHGLGYTPTDAGNDLMRVAEVADDQFKKLSNRINDVSNDLQGDLLITSMDAFSHVLMPAIVDMKKLHPNINIKFIATTEVLKLEYGEAHISLRPGRDQISGNKVIPFCEYAFALYASESYLEINGRPESFEDITKHKFIKRHGKPRTPFEKWMIEHVPAENIVFESTSPAGLEEAMLEGAGISFAPIRKVSQKYPSIQQVFPIEPFWKMPLRLIMHEDSYGLEKVQAFLDIFHKHYPTPD